MVQFIKDQPQQDINLLNSEVFGLIAYFLLFPNQNLFAVATNLRTVSLAIYSHAADLKPDVVLNSLINNFDAVSKNQWWECKCLAIIVFSKAILSYRQNQSFLRFSVYVQQKCG
ncbi:hypothetical protein ABPG74_006085 [Tetrahymena malaccensis]